MIRRVVDFALTNRLLVLGLALILFAGGIVSFKRLPIEAYPDVADNYVEIITQWPGISAEQVEQQVTIPLEVANPGLIRVGMFVTATFYGKQAETRAAVPAAAILHLHDREWVYTPVSAGHFKRLEVTTGNMLPGNMQEVVSGIKPGDQVVSNALALQNTVEQ